MYRIPLRRTLRWAAIPALLLVAQLAVGIAPASAVTFWNGARAAHPYSNPVWWPVNSSGTTIGCYHGNGAPCQNPLQHTVYAMDVPVPNYSSTPVYAMGAGVVHVESTGWHCDGSQSRGNWLYVDHSNGVRTEYGHLGTIYVHTGDYVTARTKLAVIGQSGYKLCAKWPGVRYLWLAVRHGSSYFHFTSSFTCVGGSRVTWPQRLSPSRTDWNAVPARTALPNSTRTCAPDTPPTPAKPGSTSLARAGAGKLRAAWARARSTDHVTVVNVELQEYHPTTHQWSDYANRHLAATSTATTFTGLPAGRSFRTRVWMYNSTGWSAPSYWHAAVPS